MWEYEWQEDVTLSDYGIDEAANPIVVIADKAIKNGKTAIGHARLTKKGNIALDLLTLSTEEVEEEEGEEQSEINETIVQSWIFIQPFLALFCGWIYEKTETSPFVVWPPDELKDLKLSEVGQKWASENLGEIWVKAGLQPEKRAINSLNEDEAEKLCVAAGIMQSEDELKFE